MSDVRARYPELIRLAEAGNDSPPTIVGQACGACGRRSFPPDPYGCEACGAPVEQLARTELAATGVVHAVAFARREELAGDFFNTSRDGYMIAHEVSAYSLTRRSMSALASVRASGLFCLRSSPTSPSMACA